MPLRCSGGMGLQRRVIRVDVSGLPEGDTGGAVGTASIRGRGEVHGLVLGG